MKNQTKKWSMLTAAVLLTLSSMAFPQMVRAGTVTIITTATATALSGTDSNTCDTKAKADPKGTAIGNDAVADWAAVAVGYGTKATNTSATAVGYQVTAEGLESIAIGNLTQATEADSIAIGDRAKSEEYSGIAIGAGATVETHGLYAMAFGDTAKASAARAVAIGVEAKATAERAVAFGDNASATAKRAVALGVGASATASSAVALGSSSVADEDDTVSVGSWSLKRKIVNVADGTASSDAATWGQLIKNTTDPYTFDEDGIATILTNGTDLTGKNNTAFKLKLSITGGSIANNDTGYVTGGKIYSYVTPTSTDTKYVKTSQTTGENLTALDTAVSGLNTAVGTVDRKYTFIDQSRDDNGGVKTTVAQNLINLDQGITKLISYDTLENGTIRIGSGEGIKADTVSFFANDGATRKLTGIAYGGDSTDAAAYGQIAKAGQTVKAVAGSNTIVSNDGKTTIATFEVGKVAESDNGFVSGGAVYNAITEAKTAMTYKGSDTIVIDDKTISVKNMAMSTEENETVAKGIGSFAIGAGSIVGSDLASTDYSMALGYKAQVARDSSISLGAYSKAQGDYSIAVGAGYADYENSGANALGTCAIAIGRYSTASKEEAIALGDGANAEGIGSVAIGAGSRATEKYTVSVGSGVDSAETRVATRRIVNVSDGIKSSDAATYGQIAVKEQMLDLSDKSYSIEVKDFDNSTHITSRKANEIRTNDGELLATFTKMMGVTEKDYGFVSGHDLWTETRAGITVPANYISADSTTGANLFALDAAIGAKTSVEGLYETNDSVEAQMAKVGGKTLQTVTDAVSTDADHAQKATLTTYDGTEYTIEVAGQGEVKAGDKRLVDGGTVSAAISTAIDGNTYEGSDTISIAKENGSNHYTVRVKNMAMSTTNDVTAAATATGTNALALGAGGSASGAYAQALGTKAQATGRYSIALGYGAEAAENAELPVIRSARALLLPSVHKR